jgi:dipeptidase D
MNENIDKMKRFNGLEPGAVFTFFEEICEIPRPSKKEDKIRSYLKEFAGNHDLDFKVDTAGNVLISKHASRGKENCMAVILQSHLDMVCEKNSDINHDFENDKINAFIDGEWIRAKGTTLGADDGIGIAAQLAILSDDKISHGPVECLFTVDEETGLTGANQLEQGFFKAKILLNLDSEDEGELFIGCAGGIDTIAEIAYKPKNIPSQHISFEVNVKGLKGGHSGDDIDKGLGNSNKILNRFLWNASRKFDIRIALFDGGNLRNAIPREASAIFTVHSEHSVDLLKYFKKFSEQLKNRFKEVEPGLLISLIQADMPESLINKKAQCRLLNCLYACPNGVIDWSSEMEGLVETSTNLASVKFIEENKIIITTSQRSSVDFGKFDIANQVSSVFKLANAEVTHSIGYPGWKPDKNSVILKITENSYKKLFNESPKVKAIHAGLECGLFLEKYPGLDMISFGPTIKGAHSPDERLDIKSVKKFWDLLVEVLNNIPGK